MYCKTKKSSSNYVITLIISLSTFSTDAACELNVLWHDGHPLGVNRTQVGVLKQTHQVSLRSFLKRKNSVTLEPQISLEVLRDFTNKTLKGELADQKLCALLVFSDLTKSNSSRAIAMRLLDSTGCRCRFPCSLGGELLPRSLSTGGFASGLLGTSHGKRLIEEEDAEKTEN